MNLLSKILVLLLLTLSCSCAVKGLRFDGFVGTAMEAIEERDLAKAVQAYGELVQSDSTQFTALIAGVDLENRQKMCRAQEELRKAVKTLTDNAAAGRVQDHLYLTVRNYGAELRGLILKEIAKVDNENHRALLQRFLDKIGDLVREGAEKIVPDPDAKPIWLAVQAAGRDYIPDEHPCVGSVGVGK